MQAAGGEDLAPGLLEGVGKVAMGIRELNYLWPERALRQQRAHQEPQFLGELCRQLVADSSRASSHNRMMGAKVNQLGRPHALAAVEHQPVADLNLINGLPGKLNPLVLARQADEQRMVQRASHLIASPRSHTSSREWATIEPLAGGVHAAGRGEHACRDILGAIRDPVDADQAFLGNNEGIATDTISHRGRRIPINAA